MWCLVRFKLMDRLKGILGLVMFALASTCLAV